ncbi:efflux RND transporter periplasmic adaptor subunit [Psychrosphaera ytuae]|uniref:Efflux RND transporter periplasmic adaptor subunit n=1 Tax=Psychrosphaera ytuae TaxID=2820710 RepID=A0A975D9N1_9GAMM|nr:efflux RND transporter periplasmic adaptor subunit [Psychrosphaera ytuae]
MVVRTTLFIIAIGLLGFPAFALEALQIKAQDYSKQSFRVGQLAFFKTYQASFKSSGNITQLAIEEGQMFKKGEILAKVDTDDLSSELNQLIAEKAFVNKEIERLTKLKKVNAVSQSELDRLKSRSSQLRAQIIRTREFLDAAHIVANFDGVVISRLVDAGEFVAAGQAVLDIAPTVDNYVVEVAVQDRLLAFLTVGMQVELTSNLSGSVLLGEVKTLAQVPDRDTGLFVVKIAVNEAPEARIGSLYKVRLTQNQSMVYPVPVSHAQLDFNNTAIVRLVTNKGAFPTRMKVVDHDFETVYLEALNGDVITIETFN